MEVAKRREIRINGTSAYALEASPKQEERRAPKAKPAARAKLSLSNGVRFSILVCIVAASVAGLMVVSRYSAITKEYAKVNALKGDIESVQTRINTLNVALECAVNIKEVQETAKKWGMTYPTIEQYVQAGDPLPQAQDRPGMADTAEASETPPPDGGG